MNWAQLRCCLSRQRPWVRALSSPPFLPNHLRMIGSYSLNPQLNLQRLLHCCVHPHGGRSAQRSESHSPRKHQTVHPARRLKPLPGPLPKYTLTRICSVEYIKSMESVFEIIAEPNRRAILSLLVSSQQSVGEIERQLRMTQPTVSKHLRVLREAGFVESTVDAQRRLY